MKMEAELCFMFILFATISLASVVKLSVDRSDLQYKVSVLQRQVEALEVDFLRE